MTGNRQELVAMFATLVLISAMLGTLAATLAS